MLKNILTGIAAAVGMIFLLIVLFLAIQSIRLEWWAAPEGQPPAALTPQQKADDMRYLLDLIGRVSPAEVVWETAGLENPLRQPEVWVERARQAPSDSAFADLVMQMLVHLGQGGHAFPAYDVQYNPVTSLVGDIPRGAFAKMPYWSGVISRLPWNAHASLEIVYRGGLYLLERDAVVDGDALPAGSVVESVDGASADAFALQQQYRAHLRYDPFLKKFFLHPLLIVDPGRDRPGWNVAFRLPDGSRQEVLVRKIPGYAAHRPDERGAANTRCMALSEDVLYIKMATFYREHVQADAAELRRCFTSGQYQTAIFDVRGNGGGEIWSYMDNVIAPLIRKPAAYQATAAIRRSFYAWHGWRFGLYQLENDNELLDARARVEKIEEIDYPPYSDQVWCILRVTRRIEPAAEPYPFEGAAYVLADNNTLSAGDSFAAAMQQSGLAKVIGANTAGWGQAAQAKMLYALPESGLLFYADSELTINSDGSLNNYAGVMPDMFLNPSAYPTPYPASFSREALLADAWVQWVLADVEQAQTLSEIGGEPITLKAKRQP